MILRNDGTHVIVGHQSNHLDSGRFNRVESMTFLKSNQDAILLGFGAICVLSSLFIPDASQPLLMACGVSL